MESFGCNALYFFYENEILVSRCCIVISLLYSIHTFNYRLDTTSIECESPLVPVSFSRIYGSNGYKETYEIWKGDAKTGVRVYYENGNNHDGETVGKELCLDNTLHTIVLLCG